MSEEKVYKIELNNYGDFIEITTNAELFSRFTGGYRLIADMAERLPKKYREIDWKYGESGNKRAIEIARVHVDFSKKAEMIIDDIFGACTVRKYFRELYENIEYFTPYVKCFIDFYDQMLPILEKLFECKASRAEKSRIRSMDQYDFYSK